jgi:hypothetical protein
MCATQQIPIYSQRQKLRFPLQQKDKTMPTSLKDDFYIVAYEPGAEHPALPSWASRKGNPADLASEAPQAVTRVELAEIPGAYQLLNVLSLEECQRLIETSEAMGYLPDAAVSLPRHIRHNDNLVWIVDTDTEQRIWQRVSHLVQQDVEIYGGKPALGLNQRFRFYRYGSGDFFKPHSDGAWPGSCVTDEHLVSNAYPDRFSQATFLMLLSDDFRGGATRFVVNADDPCQPVRSDDKARNVDVHTPAGSALCFPHGHHPLQRIHSSEPVLEGTKYIIRSDTLFTF